MQAQPPCLHLCSQNIPLPVILSTTPFIKVRSNSGRGTFIGSSIAQHFIGRAQDTTLGLGIDPSPPCEQDMADDVKDSKGQQSDLRLP